MPFCQYLQYLVLLLVHIPARRWRKPGGCRNVVTAWSHPTSNVGHLTHLLRAHSRCGTAWPAHASVMMLGFSRARICASIIPYVSTYGKLHVFKHHHMYHNLNSRSEDTNIPAYHCRCHGNTSSFNEWNRSAICPTSRAIMLALAVNCS